MDQYIKDELYRIFPVRIRNELKRQQWFDERADLEEIRIRVGQPILWKFQTEWLLGEKMQKEDLQEMFLYLCEYSPYAYQEQIGYGFLTLKGGIRVGIAGQATVASQYEDGVCQVEYPMYFNIRVPSQRFGCAKNLLPYLWKSSGEIYHTLLISPPGLGKTTLLRDLIRLLSAKENIYAISVVDERYEIAASWEGVPQNEVGQKVDIYPGYSKGNACKQAIRTMAPQILAVDEIGHQKDGEILQNAMRSGVKIIATMHGDDLEEYKWLYGQKMTLHFQRFVLLEKEKTGKRIQKIYDEKGKLLCVEE